MLNTPHFIRYFTNEPVVLSFKGKLLSVIACFFAIYTIAQITQVFSGSTQPILVASMGASAAILFIIPNSPIAQPWPFAGGQILSSMVGVFCAMHISDIALAAAFAAGGSVLVMLLMRCLHPPSSATALAPVLAADSLGSLGYSFTLIPVTINVFALLTFAIIVNRWLLGKNYPEPLPASNTPVLANNEQYQLRLSAQDIEKARVQMGSFINMTTTELIHFHGLIESQIFQRLSGSITCADIMTKQSSVAEFATEVEDAWKTMIAQESKAMPVLDRSRRVIGILVWSDFFKYINMDVHEGIQEKIRGFIQRTKQTYTDKPEVVGQIMSSTVALLREDSHIAELIPLMSERGFRQIPIINDERRYTGMVYQADLIAALYHDQIGKGLRMN